MRVLAFRHAEGEDLGTVRPILEARGVEVRCVDLYAGAGLPDIGSAAGLIVMGGAMCANDDRDFLHRELDLIREAAGRRQPVFGICLGAQLIAKALGGRVNRSAVDETGWSSIALTDAAGSDPFSHGWTIPRWSSNCTTTHSTCRPGRFGSLRRPPAPTRRSAPAQRHTASSSIPK